MEIQTWISLDVPILIHIIIFLHYYFSLDIEYSVNKTQWRQVEERGSFRNNVSLEHFMEC